MRKLKMPLNPGVTGPARSMTTKLYIFRFLDGLLPILSLYLLLFQDKGISPLQISALLIMSSVVYIGFEIPSGALADTFSKRRLVVMGEVLRALGYLAWLVMPNLLGFAAGMVLWGVSSAFISGTYPALLYDELKAEGAEKQYVRIMGKSESIGLIARATAAGLASLAILSGYWLVLAISIAAAVGAAIVASRFPNPPVAEAAEKRYFEVLRRAFVEIYHKRQMLLAVLFLAVIASALAGFIQEFSQIYLAAAGIAKPLIPLLVLAIIVPSVIASYTANRFETMSQSLGYVVLLVTGLLLFLAGYLTNWFGLLAIGVAMFSTKLLMVLMDGTMQHTIDSHSRVTIASVREAGVELTVALMYAVYGIVATYKGTGYAYMGIGALVMAAALAYLVIHPARRKLLPAPR